MKILYVIPYSPANPTFGGSLRIYNILKYLTQKYDVTVVGFSTSEEEKQLIQNFPVLAGKTHFVEDLCSNTSTYFNLMRSLFSFHSLWYLNSRSHKLQLKINEVCLKNTFDVIQCEFPVMGMFTFNSDAIKVLDAHNVEYDNFQRMAKVKNPLKKLFYLLESYKFNKEETAVCRKQNALFVTSERDINLFEKPVPAVPKYLVPNGVDETFFYPGTKPGRPHSLVFVGMMKYVPNCDGILYFLDEIFPKILAVYPDATITICGKNPPRAIVNRTCHNIIVTGFVGDTRPYIHEASVYVVPLRMGGGTRLKIMEALASKIPLVTTSIGCEGIDLEHNKHALITDKPDAFAKAVIELFDNQELCDSLSYQGYELVMSKYRWATIGAEMERAFEELTGIKANDYSSDEDRMKYESNGIYS
ncbi:MAG: glycosyltransferase family 4 protein [Balneolales bacterium]|nr:glycosyltransferase family 4 protein [Balneolales bacterium]